MRCISVTYNSSWLLAHDGNAILGLLKINYLMPWCLCLTVSCVWFVLQAISSCGQSLAAGLKGVCSFLRGGWGRMGRAHTRHPCVCLLSLHGPHSWCEDFLCLLPVPPSPAPLPSANQPDPSLTPLLPRSLPPLGLIWYVQWCDKTKREVFDCTNTPFGEIPAREESVKESESRVGRPRCQDRGKCKLRRKK